MRTLLVIAALVPTTARAWAPADRVELDLGAVPGGIAAGTWDGAPAVVWTGEAGTRVIDPATGETLVSSDRPGRDVILRDLDRDGTAEIVGCGEQGLAMLRGARGDDAPSWRPLSDAPCEQISTYDVGRFDALITAAGSRVTSWVPQGGALQPTPVADELGGPALFATRGAEVVAAGAGASVVVDLAGQTTELDGPVLALAPGATRFWAVLGGAPAQLVALDGTVAAPLEPVPRALVSLSLGPGEPLLGLVDGRRSRVGLVDADGALAWVAVPVEPHLVTAAELSGDDCADLVVFGRDGAGVMLIGDCTRDLPVASALGEDEAGGGWAEVATSTVKEKARVALPPPPTEHILGETWGDLHLFVGQRAEVQLLDGRGRATRYASRGGPPGFATTSSGVIDFTPEPEDVGTWRASVHLGAYQGWVRWSGMRVHIHPDPGATAAGGSDGSDGSDESVGSVAPAPVPAPNVSEPSPAVEAVRAPTSPPLGLEECQLALGVAGGVAKAGGVTWEELGQPDVRGGGSPLAGLQCIGAISGPLGWMSGVDTAPFFEYASLPADRTHVLAVLLGVEVGSDRAAIGVYGTMGFGLRPSPGLRAVLRPFGSDEAPMGFEVRGLWLAPQLGAEVAAMWLVRL